MRTIVLVIALVALALGGGASAVSPAAVSDGEAIGGRMYFICALSVGLLVGGVATGQMYAAAAGAMAFPTACGLGW